jgi:hypothetical protein
VRNVSVDSDEYTTKTKLRATIVLDANLLELLGKRKWLMK